MDNEQFFRTCWIALKHSKPRLAAKMNAIEWDVAGRPTVLQQKTPKPDQEAGDGKDTTFTPV